MMVNIDNHKNNIFPDSPRPGDAESFDVTGLSWIIGTTGRHYGG
jgi:hypothetical protein